MRAGGAELRAQVNKDGENAREKVARLVCDALGPHLRELWLGDSTRFEIVAEGREDTARYIRHHAARKQVVGYPNP